MELEIIYLKNWLKCIKRDPENFFHHVVKGLWFYSAWAKSVNSGRDSFLDSVPWITYEAYHFIESVLKPDMVLFEYGSGGSTIFYATRVKKVVSIEHDEAWFEDVKAAIAKVDIDNCECSLITPEPDNQCSSGSNDPLTYRSIDVRYNGFNFAKYVKSIDHYPNQNFDFVCVDGRARLACVRQAISKVKLDGYLMLDNSNRDQYRGAKYLLHDWEKTDFFGPGPYNTYFWETTFWKRTSMS